MNKPSYKKITDKKQKTNKQTNKQNNGPCKQQQPTNQQKTSTRKKATKKPTSIQNKPTTKQTNQKQTKTMCNILMHEAPRIQKAERHLTNEGWRGKAQIFFITNCEFCIIDEFALITRKEKITKIQ